MKSFLRKVWTWIWKTMLVLFSLSIFFVLLFRFVPIPFTPLMLIRGVEQLSSDKKFVFKKDWESIEHISPKLVLAVVASEDNNFLNHKGFDIEAIEKAIKYNQKKKGKKIRGGSTISQQTAKNVFLWPGRSYVRKGLEAYFTLLIELIWGKERIMEVYLNVIEMGDGIYGAEAASQVYFKKPAARLTDSQAAQIAAILPNPRKWSPLNPTLFLVKKEARILRNMRNIEQVKFD